MSLWSDYIKECGIMGIVEDAHGFITYEVDGEDLWTGDGYVVPELRQTGKSEELLQQVIASGKEQGCKYICARLNIKNDKIEEALMSHLKRGCLIHSTDSEYIYVKKPI